MKKSFPILFAALLFLSGMHLTVASHFCGGKLAAVKWSFTSKEATCGMEESESSFSGQEKIASNCCHNLLVKLSVDNEYNASSFLLKEPDYKVLQQICTPIHLLFHSTINSTSFYTNVFPPGNIVPSAVSLTDICVFRI